MGIFTGMSQQDLTAYVEDLRAFLRGQALKPEAKSIWAEDRRLEWHKMDKDELRRMLAEAEAQLNEIENPNTAGGGCAIGVSMRRGL